MQFNFHSIAKYLLSGGRVNVVSTDFFIECSFLWSCSDQKCQIFPVECKCFIFKYQVFLRLKSSLSQAKGSEDKVYKV